MIELLLNNYFCTPIHNRLECKGRAGKSVCLQSQPFMRMKRLWQQKRPRQLCGAGTMVYILDP